MLCHGNGIRLDGIVAWGTRLLDAYRAARLLLLITYSVLFVAPVLLGYVVAAGNNRAEAGAAEPWADNYPSGRLFTDHNRVYIPELQHHLTGNRHSWLAVWNPHVQLGRPNYQGGGLSRAYLLVNLLSYASNNAHRVYTVFALLTLCLSGFFAFLFLEELRLHPAACYVAAVGLSLGAFCVFWLTFIMFLSTVCWTLALFWLVTCYANRQTLWALPGIAFAVYSLLATGYPVLIVLFGYTLGAYSLVAVLGKGRGVRRNLLLLTGMAGAVALGTIASLPIYLDVLHAGKASARLDGVADSFYLAVYPSFARWTDLLVFAATNVDPFSLGDPNLQEYPACTNGFQLSPVYFLLAGISVTQIRSGRFQFWFLAAAIYALLSVWSPAYLFAVHYLGLGLSRCRCTWGLLIPVFMLAALGMDGVLRSRPSWRLWTSYAIWAAALAAMYVALAWSGTGCSVWAALVAAAATALFALFLLTRSSVLVAGLALATSVLYGSQIAQLRPLDAICGRSPLTETLQETHDGSCRFAKIGDMAALPSNEEAFLGLCSVHSYDSLSSRRYQNLVRTWCARGCQEYGRWFSCLDGGLHAEAAQRLALAGVKYLLSAKPLELGWVEPVAVLNGNHVYRSKLEPVRLCQTHDFIVERSDVVRLAADASLQPVRYAERKDDWRRVLTPSQETPSLLFVSEQFHAFWRASSKGSPLVAVAVNDFYLGVLLPPGTEEVELEFAPFARWSWIPQLAFLTLGLAWGLHRVVDKSRTTPDRQAIAAGVRSLTGTRTHRNLN